MTTLLGVNLEEDDILLYSIVGKSMACETMLKALDKYLMINNKTIIFFLCKIYQNI